MNLFQSDGGFLLYSAYFVCMKPVISLNSNISAFANKLQDIIISELPISNYSKRYLQHLFRHSNYYLSIYTHVLENLLLQSGKAPDQINMVDYGAGNGLLGMFAKFCGFNKVYLCDRDSDFVHASLVLANELNIEIDKFICGDIDSLKSELSQQTIHAVAGTDVVEHIYNLDVFFAAIHTMNPAMVSVFTTASNPDNFFKVMQLKKLQRKDELLGSDPEDAILTGAEKQEAYIVLREKIIKENFPQLTGDKLMELAKATRGLSKPDIIKTVEVFIQTSKMPDPVIYGSNTCNPLTGSWTERVLSINDYKSIYERHGFSLIVKNGFYNDHTAGIKKYMNKILNRIVKMGSRNTAPFITLVGYKSG